MAAIAAIVFMVCRLCLLVWATAAKTDLTTLDCSLRRSATQPLILAASCPLPFFLMNVGFTEKHPERNCVATGCIHNVIYRLYNVLRKSSPKF